MKEYERTSTTVVNGYLLPAMQRYSPISPPASRAAACAPRCWWWPPTAAWSERARRPSVPSSSSARARRLASPAPRACGAALGEPNLIVFDMGGTTAKASLVETGQPTLTTEYEFREGMSTSSRFIKAGGYMLKVPAIDIAEVGTGAGSIA